MAVNLSPIGGVAGQFFDNNGNPLSGGKIFTYAAGTTTPLTTYTSAGGGTPHANPIILDAAGRVPGGEIWLTDGLQYKFIIQTSTNVQIGSYDNIIGINSNFVNYTNSQEIQTATAGQTVFTLTTMQYQPGTNSLSVFVDGVNQYGPGSMYAYQETSSTVVTFTAGLHVGAQVKFVTSAINASSYGDAEQISYNPPFTGGVATNVEAKLAQTVSLKDFGAVGDGTTDDAAAIQAALVYAFANGVDVVGDGASYAVGSTILIPQNWPGPSFVTARNFTLDFRNSIFVMLANTPLFESAYDNAGVLTTNYGTALDSHYSVGIKLTNFGVESNVGQLTQPVLKIQDWHQQCEISGITCGVAQVMLWANNCYYMTVDNVKSTLIAPSAGDRFVWFNNTNLCKISRLVAGNSITGYKFEGPVTATVMDNMSFEGMTTGALFNATVYDIAITNSYFESFSDVAISFASYVDGAIIDNNYVNFLSSATSYFLYYQPLPGANVTVTRSNSFVNMPSNANIIKNREDVYGSAIVIERLTSAVTNINDFKVDNTVIGRRIDWRQKVTKPNIIANVNNDYIPGNYSSRFTDGWANSNGFEWVNLSSTTLRLRTRITQNFVQLVYVNIEVSFVGGGPTYIRGLFIGNQFYKATNVSFAPSTDLGGSTDANGYLQIDGGYFFAGNLTGVTGEIRLI